MEIANGIEPDGIKYKCYLKGSDWIVEVKDNKGNILSDQFHWQARPVCGPDVLDVERAEEMMDKLINQIRG